MEQKIITNNGKEYILKSDNFLTQEQIKSIISQLSVKTLSKTCITAATVGQTLSLQNTIQSGTAPYNVSIKKDGSVMQNWTATNTLTQSINYQLQQIDIGTRRFSVDVTDSCSTGAKSTTEFCDVVVSAVVTCILNVGSFVNYVGNNQWLYEFSFPAKGTEHITLRTWFNRQSAPFGIDKGIYRCALDVCDSNGESDYLDTINVTSKYRVYLNTDLGWTSTYSCTPTPGLCSWIISVGGWNAISAYNIMTLVSAYAGATNLGFTVTAVHIMGAVAYYAAKGTSNPSAGNSLTGCGFT